MSPTEVGQILEAVALFHAATDKNFNEVYRKIDSKFDECNRRLVIVETAQAIKMALNGQKKEDETAQRDYWQYIIRILSATGILALLGIAAKLIIFGITSL